MPTREARKPAASESAGGEKRDVGPGLFLKASGGTLFLDEIGELPTTLQAKLLRALQERRVRAVGGDREQAFDARIVSATHRDLTDLTARGGFREDLLYRLDVVRVELPPPRERGTDVLLLTQELLAGIAKREGRSTPAIDPACAQKLLAYPWPGNVRELANVVERAMALGRGDTIEVEDLPDKIRQHQSTHVLVSGDDPAELVTLEEVEKRYILRVLHACGEQRTRAARVLGIDRKTLYHKLRTWGMAEEP